MNAGWYCYSYKFIDERLDCIVIVDGLTVSDLFDCVSFCAKRCSIDSKFLTSPFWALKPVISFMTPVMSSTSISSPRGRGSASSSLKRAIPGDGYTMSSYMTPSLPRKLRMRTFDGDSRCTIEPRTVSGSLSVLSGYEYQDTFLSWASLVSRASDNTLPFIGVTRVPPIESASSSYCAYSKRFSYRNASVSIFISS